MRISDWSSDVCSSDLPTLSFRGLDNAAYYRLLPDAPRHHINDTGCGNTVNFSHPAVIRMTLDSLRYWVQEFHVDGFRFDLGVTLGRETQGFDPGAGFFDALMQDPLLSRVTLISEPWDIGPGGDRQHVVTGTSVSVRVDPGGRRIIKK